MQNSAIRIIPLILEEYADFTRHMDRHILESGNGGIHFMPFIPGDSDRPIGVALDKLSLAIGEKGWHRCWVALDVDADRFVGHVDLKGGNLKTALHRCELGMGVEAAYRRCGLGSRLLDTAISFALGHPLLHWIDLGTFSGNAPARALYRKKGFKEVGVVKDRFRINGTSIDDVLMTLRVQE